jgi:hypothetical protein
MIPLAPRTARAIDLAIGERTDGPVFLTLDGRRLDRHGAGRIVRKVARRAVGTKVVTPHTLRHAFITAAQGPGARCAMSKRLPPMLIRGPRCGTTGPAAVWTGTPPISSPRISPGLPGNPRAGSDSAWRPQPPGGQRVAPRGRPLGGYGPRPQQEREPPNLYAGLCYFEKAAEALITMIWRASELLRAPGCFAL